MLSVINLVYMKNISNLLNFVQLVEKMHEKVF